MRFRLSLAALTLPAVGLLVLLQAAPLQSPLSESEASLAIAVRYPARELARSHEGGAGATATALMSVGPSLLGTSESRLRAAGVLAGCLSLGLVVRLGERLFSTATGVLAAVILLSTATGRTLLGTEFTVEPFFVVAMLAAVGGIRNLARDRRSAIRSGIAGGTAIALVGASALWIPAMTLVWLRRLYGLTLRSFGVVVSTTAATAAALAAVSAAVLGVSFEGVVPMVATTALSKEALLSGGIELLPVLPPVLLGLWSAPAQQRAQGSPRFLSMWLAFAAATAWWTGAVAALWIAVCMWAAVFATWALGGASRRSVLASLGLSALLAIGLDAGLPEDDASEVHDRWAVRETGKFLRRNLESDSTIAAAPGARGRLAYYATRPIEPLERTEVLDGFDYVVLDRAVLASAESSRSDRPPPRELEVDGHALRVLAEFGPWVLARVGGSDEGVTVPAPEKPSGPPAAGVKSAYLHE